MRSNGKKSIDEKQSKIIAKWIIIATCVYFPITIILPYLARYFVKEDIFKGYYENFTSELSINFGFALCLIGFMVNELLYLFRNKKYKVAIIVSVLSACILSINFIILVNGYAYKYYKDLQYVMKGTYCEEVQNLKYIYKEKEAAKPSITTLYVQTSDFKFQLNSDIVQVKDFEEFKAKFDKVKKVKIGYLPNSKRVLYIEPADDESTKK